MSVKAGALRFNTDSLKLELYDGNQWVEIVATSPEAQTGGARGLIAGGYTPGLSAAISYINLSTTGNSVTFGNLLGSTERANGVGGYSSRTRGIFGCGQIPGPAQSSNILDYITFSSTGDAQDFGDATIKSEGYCGVSNSTRGIAGGGFHRSPGAGSYVNTLDYVTIASTGDAVDFGDMTVNNGFCATGASSTRGIWGPGNGNPTNIYFVTISTLGNAADFGDTTDSRYQWSGGISSNSTRFIMAGGEDYTPGTKVNIIDYVEIATLGNAIDFGDLTTGRSDVASLSSPTRIAFAGGNSGSIINTIDYVQIMSTGNAIDFGDVNSVFASGGSVSNGHGGL
jgi:hypothetical protein